MVGQHASLHLNNGLSRGIERCAGEGLKASLTVEELSSQVPSSEPESDQLGRYCQKITQLLMNGSLPRQSEVVMADLLCELIGYFSDTLKTPHWLKTDEGNSERLNLPDSAMLIRPMKTKNPPKRVF